MPLETMDQTRKQARITFDATPARVIGELDDGARAIETMLDHAMIALSANRWVVPHGCSTWLSNMRRCVSSSAALSDRSR